MHFSFAAVALLLSSTLAHTVPLTKGALSQITTSQGYVNFTALQVSLAHVKAKYESNRIALAVNMDNKTTTPRMTRNARRAHSSYGDTLAARGTLWTGPVSIGTPGKTFQMDFDTGSTDTIICGSSACSNSGARKIYQAKQSRTAVPTSQTFTNYYGDGSSTSGTITFDTLRFGNLVNSKRQLSEATEMGGLLSTLAADGVVGLAWPSLSSVGAAPLEMTLRARRKIKLDEFALRLSNTAGVSEIFIGGYNHEKLSGKIAWYPMATEEGNSAVYSYLQIANGKTNVNGAAISTSAATYIIDSGTTLILAPVAAAKRMWSAVPGSAPLRGPYQGFYSYPCHSTVTISFSFAGSEKQHFVDPQDLSYGKIEGSAGLCLGAILGVDAGLGTSWILGDSFLKGQYSIFNLGRKRIGFATPV